MSEIKTKVHSTEAELADFLAHVLDRTDRKRVEDHIAQCDECLNVVVSAYESVKSAAKKGTKMKKINLYLILAIISFALSFVTPRFFLQFLVATLVLGTKWVVDSKTTKMLIMIHEAWKKGGEKEAGRILHTLESESKNRL